jgi:hypothetical protein
MAISMYGKEQPPFWMEVLGIMGMALILCYKPSKSGILDQGECISSLWTVPFQGDPTLL